MIQFVVIPNFSEAVDTKARMDRVSKLRAYASRKLSDAYKKSPGSTFSMDNVKDARKAHRASKIADKGERRLLFPKK